MGARIPIRPSRVRSRVQAILLGALVFSAGCSRPGRLVLEPREWDFGTVSSSTAIEREVTVENSGRRDVEVTFVSTCECLTVEPSRLELRRGAIRSVRLGYDPSEDEGDVRMRVIVRAAEGRSVSRTMVPVFGRVQRQTGVGERVADERPPDTSAVEDAVTRESQLQLSFEYFYDPGCRACEAFIRSKVWLWEQELDARIEVQRRNLNDPEIMALYEQRMRALGTEEQAYPAVVFNGVVLQGYDEIERELKSLLERVQVGKGNSSRQ